MENQMDKNQTSRDLASLLPDLLTDQLIQMTISDRREETSFRRIRIRPIRKKEELFFQAAKWDGKKEFHENGTREEMTERILDWMRQEYKQLQADCTYYSAAVMVSKKGKQTIRIRQHEDRPAPLLSHNRKKRYVLEEGVPVPFLVQLGLMTPEGKVVASRYDKFRQINRFLEFVEDICPALPQDRELTILDFGCGKSYLTFAMYYYLHEKRGYEVSIIGLDLKEDVIAHCNRLAEEFGYEKLHFLVGDISQYEGADQVDMVVTLHACDTATDFALAKAISWNARVILSVPCCQHELNWQIRNDMLAPVLKYGLLKERMSALLTDGIRAALLEQAGYQVQVLEFIDMEHTPKNILLRAVSSEKGEKKEQAMAAKEREELSRLLRELQVSPTLEKLLRDNHSGTDIE